MYSIVFNALQGAVAGKIVTLMYNRAAGPINFFEIPVDQAVVLKFGHNGWKGTTDVSMKRSAAAAKDGEGKSFFIPCFIKKMSLSLSLIIHGLFI